MSKNLQAFSIIFLGICIVISSWIMSQAIETNEVKSVEIQEQLSPDKNRYEFIEIAGNHNMIFDKQTGDYWSNINGQGWEKSNPISIPED